MDHTIEMKENGGFNIEFALGDRRWLVEVRLEDDHDLSASIHRVVAPPANVNEADILQPVCSWRFPAGFRPEAVALRVTGLLVVLPRGDKQ
jgi:hypothetical protein